MQGSQRQVTRPSNKIRVYLIASILLIDGQHVAPFNLDAESAVLHQGPAGSYFGYSVAQHRDRGVGWLLVGAPRAQTDQPETRHSGAVYRCSPSSPLACQQIPFDPTGASVIQLRGRPTRTDDKSHQWFGASLQSATDNGSIVACAARYVYYSSSLRRRDPVGTCWVSRGSFGGFLEYSPCRLNDQWGHHRLGSCQAGFSSAISKDGSRLFMGAPGSHVWQGQVFAHNLRSDLTNSSSPSNPTQEDDSYLGYSLALATLNRASGSPELAIGIPRGADLDGKVMIVDAEIRTLRNLTGDQMGAYFGYSLAWADLNGDGLDDLLVGAPFHFNASESSRPQFDRGRVYVAMQVGGHNAELNIAQRIDASTRNGARFGSAIANCGDLNRDGREDVAVGAPYDGPDGHGAVYIFMGRKWGLNLEHDQVIFAESLGVEGRHLRSFGFSLSGGLDLDGNGYPDLLVGDYQADRAVLLRSRPVVDVSTWLSFQPDHFNLDDKSCRTSSNRANVSCMDVQFCMKFNGHQLDDRLHFRLSITLDSETKGSPRMFFLHNEASNREESRSVLTKDVVQCRSFQAYIGRQIRDKLTPLKVDVNYDLIDSYSEESSQLRPILNKLEPNSRMDKTTLIQRNCGHDNVCVPDLRLTVNPNIEQYTLGSNEQIVLEVVVVNLGEDAHESMFHLTMPMTVNFIKTNQTRAGVPSCTGSKPDQFGINKLACDLGNPQVRNDVIRFSVIMEPARNIILSAPDFTFIANVNSSNRELDERHYEDNQVAIGIPVRVQVDLKVSGNSVPPLIVPKRKTTMQQSSVGGMTLTAPKISETEIGPEIYHVYQVRNTKLTAVNEAELTLYWPMMDKYDNYLLYLLEEPKSSSNVFCKPIPVNPLGLRLIKNSPMLRSADLSISGPQHGSLERYKRQISRRRVDMILNQPIEQKESHCGHLNRCVKIECNIFGLGNNEMATLKLRSRLFEDSLGRLVSLRELDLSSKLLVKIKPLTHNASYDSLPTYVIQVKTNIHSGGLMMQNLPRIAVASAILLGVCLFFLSVLFLRHLGFFARTRRAPDEVNEQEPLNPTVWSAYHYSPGDIAL